MRGIVGGHMTYTAVIPGRLPGANDYIAANRTNRYGAAKIKKDVEEPIMWCVARMPKITKPVIIHLNWIEPNARRDLDNIAFGKKFIMDALQKAGVLPNDNRNYVRGFTDSFAIDKENPRIEMRIEEV